MKVSTEPVPLLARFSQGQFSARCSTRVVLDHITSKWGVLIIAALSERTLRWSDLRRRADGISEKMLAQTLKTLERDGFVRRDAQPVIPPRVDYSLTDRGRDLASLLMPLLDWIAAHADEIVAQPSDDHEVKPAVDE